MTGKSSTCDGDDGGVGGYAAEDDAGATVAEEGGDLGDKDDGVEGCHGAARIDVGVRGHVSDVGVVGVFERLREVGVGGRW